MRRTTHRTLATFVAAVIGLWLAAAMAMGSGTTLYAAPGGATSGSCDYSQPCNLSFAIAQAPVGSTVLATPGTYSVTSGIVVAKAITVEGDPSQARPSLVGTTGLGADVLTASAGATVRHLDVQTTTNSLLAHSAALVIDGATAEDITASAGGSDSQGQAIVVKDSPLGTTLRTVLAVSAAPGGEAVSLKDSDSGAGTASVVNLTAVSNSSQTNAIVGNVVAGTVTLRNVIATGSGTNIVTKPGTQPINVSFSNFASTSSGAVSDGGGNASTPPLFVNAGAGDYHEASGSPTIATGSSSTTMSVNDLDGYAWPASSPDMGAYEFQSGSSSSTTTTTSSSTSTTASSTTTASSSTTTTPTSSTTTTPTTTPTSTPPAGPAPNTAGAPGPTPTASSPSARQELPLPSAPIPGQSVTLGPASGIVLVKLPGAHAFTPLTRAAQVPLGTVIDTTSGAVSLTSASGPDGETKTGTFHGGLFTVSQTAGHHPETLLRLVGDSFTGCPVARPTVASPPVSLFPIPVFAFSFTTAVFGAGHPHPSAHSVVRQLWGGDNGGHFTTIGRSGSAAVRGTVWLTQDRCDGTLVRVLRGRVLVTPTGVRHGVMIGAGHQYLARAH